MPTQAGTAGRSSVVAALAATLYLALATPAFGANIEVTTAFDPAPTANADDGNCTLREAVASANNNAHPYTQGEECRAGDPDNVGVDVIDLTQLSYTLSNAAQGDIEISSDVRIQGQPGGTKIDGFVTGQPLNDRLFTITGATTDVTFDHVELTGGRAKNGTLAGEVGMPGGAVSASAIGSLALIDSSLHDNEAGDGQSGTINGPGGGGGQGGAVWIGGGTLTVRDSTLEQNKAGAGGQGGMGGSFGQGGQGGAGGPGGAIFAEGTTVTIEASRVAGNDAGAGGTAGTSNNDPGIGPGFGGDGGGGGGLRLIDALATIEGTTIAANDAGDGRPGEAAPSGTGSGGGGGAGGGVLSTGGSLSLTESTVDANTAGGGGAGCCGRSAGGSGGGIQQEGPLAVVRSAIIGNFAGDGGQRSNVTDGSGPGGSGGGVLATGSGAKTLANSTISGNHAGAAGPAPPAVPAGTAGLGGGLAVAGDPATVAFATFASNAAGAGSQFLPPGAGTGAAGTGGAISGDAALRATITRGNGTDSCANGTFTDAGTNFSFLDGNCPGADVDPKLGPLAVNGATTKTHALLTGSPAINAAGLTGCPATDQRGITRPRQGACDSGAFEFVPSPPAPPGPNPGGNNGQTGLPQTPGGSGNEPDTADPIVRLLLRRQRLAAILRRGFRLNFRSNEGGTALLQVFVQGRDARGLKVVAARRVRVARGRKSFTAAGTQRIVAKFTRKARRRLKRRRSVKLQLRLTVTDAARNKTTKSRRVRVKR